MSDGTPRGGAVDDRNSTATSTGAAGTGTPRGGPLSGSLGLVVFFVLIAAAGILTYRAFYTAPYPEPDPLPVIYMCSETNKTFEHRVMQGEKIPVDSPHSKKKTGYPAEVCYCWDAERKPTRTEPRYIIHNKWLGKEGDPMCPDCKKPVREHNTERYTGKPATKPASAEAT